VAAVDLATGRLAWMQQLVTGTAALGFNDVSIPLAIQLPPPAFRDGVLYFDTGLGAIAAVEARTGSPRWVAHYDRAKVVALDDRALQRAERYMMTPYAGAPCLCGDTLIVRPRDRAQLLALDTASGKIRWRRRSDPGWYLIGSVPGGVYVYDGMLKFVDAVSGQTAWAAELPMRELTGRGFIAKDGIVLPTLSGISLFSLTDGHLIRTVKLPASLTEGHLVPVVQNGKLTRVLQVDEHSMRCWSWTGGTETPSLETQLVASWDTRRNSVKGGDDDENHETFAGAALATSATPAAAAPSAAAWWQQLADAAKTAPHTPGDFLYQDPDNGLLHIGSEWAVDPALVVPLTEPAAPATIADFAAPLPPNTPTTALYPLLRIDGGQAATQRDPNNPNRVYVFAGGTLTALDLSHVTPQVLWRRVTTGNLTAYAANEGRVVCCSYNRIFVFDAGTGMPLLTRSLGTADNWNERPEWITNVAVGRNQVAVFLTAEVGFRQWYDQNARSRIVEVYDIPTGAWLWRRSIGGYYNHFEGPGILGDRLYAYETPEHEPQTSFTWTLALKSGEILARDPLPKGREYAIFDDPTNRGFFLHHTGDLAWFDVAQGKFVWQVKTPLLEDEYTRPFGANDSTVVLMGREGRGPYTVNVFDRKTGKAVVSWQGDAGICPEGANEYYTFSGIANTSDLKITRHDLADPNKPVFDQVWAGLSYLHATPFNYVTGDSVVMIAYAKQYYVQPWYEYVVFSRSSGTILHHEKFSLETRVDPWNRPSPMAMRIGRNYLLEGGDGVMIVGPLTAGAAGTDGTPVDVTEMKDIVAKESTQDPLRANLFRNALTTEFPPISMALRTGSRPPLIDGNLADWQGFDPWELTPPLNWHSFTRRPLAHPEQHGATLRSAWDRDGLYLAIEVRDPSRQPAPPNADYRLGDSIRVTILGEDHAPVEQRRPGFIRDNTAWIDVAVTGTGASAHLAHLAGDENSGIQFGATGRPDLGAGGRTLELFVPWSALDLNLTEWREDRLVKLLVNVAIPDADEGQTAQGLLEFGAGVSADGVEPQRFGEIHLIDLSSERMAQMVEVIDIIPDDPKTWEIMSLIESG
ncbi:MAG TPA: PQQ-binding-like beta-propeller repeat protein, partial [Planctomycetota bacterium]|nr:PQQ-binding-like beta-propeller repeat protein [Planctomycetota bacterium]